MNGFTTAAEQLKSACQMIVSETVQDIAGVIAGNAPYDTGFLHDSVYYVTPLGDSTYGKATPSKPNQYLLEEVTPENDMQGVVGIGAFYAVFVEMGHHVHGSGTFVPPQPFFYPGFDQGAQIFEGHFSELEGLLG